MPTFLEQLTDAEIKVRFKEAFLTAGMNEKMTGAVPAGIYRGFKLTTHGSALTVTVEADGIEGDHLAIYTPADGYTLHLRRTTGDFSIDLTALASKTVVLALYADYETATDTSAVIRAYELSPSDEYTIAAELAELVTLGTVVVPASGIIPAANITPDYRKAAWATVAPERRDAVQFVEDGGFESALVDVVLQGDWTVPGWNCEGLFLSGLASLDVISVAAHTGNKYLELTLPGLAVGPVLSFAQTNLYPVVPGAILTAEVWLKQTGATVNTPAIDNFFRIIFYDSTLSAVDDFYITDQSLGNISWTRFKKTVEVPATAVYMVVLLEFFDGTVGADGVIGFDNIQVWMDRRIVGTDEVDNRANIVSELHTGGVALAPPTYTDFDDRIDRTVQMRNTGPSGGDERIEMASSYRGYDFVLDLIRGGLDMSKVIEAIGSGMLGQADAAEVPRISTPGNNTSGNYTFLWEMGGNSVRPTRMYIGPDSFNASKPVMFITTNAEWYDSGGGAYKWRFDEVGPAARLELRSNGVDVYHYTQGGTSPWDDADWNDGTTGFRSFRGATETTYGSIFGVDYFADLAQRTRLGNSLLGSAAEAIIPRLQLPVTAPATGRYVLLFEGDSAGGGTQQKPRIYVTREDDSIAVGTSGPRLVFTYNASWSGTNWSSDDTSETATRMDFAAGKSGSPENVEGVYFYRRPAIGTSWTDGAWRNDYVSPTRYTQRLLCADNVVKSWGHVNCAAGAPTLGRGFNVNTGSGSFSYFGSGPYYVDVPFVTAFSSAEYAAVASGINSNDISSTHVLQSVITPSVVRFWVKDDTNSDVVLNASDIEIYFIVMGTN